MMRLTSILTIIAVLGLLIVGCGNNPSPTEHQNSFIMKAPGAAKISIPSGSTLTSVTFYIYLTQPSNWAVDFHRITDDWDEMTVTWNSFGGAYTSDISASFMADAVGWKSADITDLVQGWMNGTYDNYGFALVQDLPYSRLTKYNSRENTEFQSYLEFCYLTDGGEVCQSTMPLGDTYIWTTEPDNNFGDDIFLNTGRSAWMGDVLPEKQSLIKFELETTEVELAEIGDTLWIDENKNGLQDDGEVGYSGATVELYNCLDELLASTTTDANGFYIFTDLMHGDYYVKFIKPEGYEFTLQNIGGDDAIDSDANANNGMTICTTLAAGEFNMTLDAGLYEIPETECDECEGKITELTLMYLGDTAAEIVVFTKKGNNVLFSGTVDPGSTFNFVGNDDKGTMGTEISIYIDGGLDTKIHTSCSQPIAIGMVFGNFEIIEGYSRNGGLLCVYDGPGEDPEDPDCGECDGKITELTLMYLGDTSAEIVVYTKKSESILFSDMVDSDGEFTFIGNDKKGTMGTEIKIFVDGEMNVQIHTSCSQPLAIGMIFGDFEVIDGYSRNGGQICVYDGEEFYGSDNDDGHDHKHKHHKKNKHHKK